MSSINPSSNQNQLKLSLHKPKSSVSIVAKKVTDLTKNWELFTYDQISDKIAELENLGASQKKVQDLSFKCRFPLVQDLKQFAKEIREVGFKGLNSTQQNEVMRLARRGG